ncbi:MAG: hypothetical protein Q7T16_00675 [Candidatus Burarchaeum sp.]|nr:hypothetical protein [Candidatus Burarchaeum sp.]MDO8339151.1 hypothetical protein [Candidatus Burarchaeum sp.]
MGMTDNAKMAIVALVVLALGVFGLGGCQSQRVSSDATRKIQEIVDNAASQLENSVRLEIGVSGLPASRDSVSQIRHEADEFWLSGITKGPVELKEIRDRHPLPPDHAERVFNVGRKTFNAISFVPKEDKAVIFENLCDITSVSGLHPSYGMTYSLNDLSLKPRADIIPRAYILESSFIALPNKEYVVRLTYKDGSSQILQFKSGLYDNGMDLLDTALRIDAKFDAFIAGTLEGQKSAPRPVEADAYEIKKTHSMDIRILRRSAGPAQVRQRAADPKNAPKFFP